MVSNNFGSLIKYYLGRRQQGERGRGPPGFLHMAPLICFSKSSHVFENIPSLTSPHSSLLRWLTLRPGLHLAYTHRRKVE